MRNPKPAAIMLAACLLVAGSTGCDFIVIHDQIKGSGTAAKENRDASDFNGIRVSGAATVVLEQGDKESVSVEADDNILPFVLTEVKDGVLRIGMEKGNSYNHKTPLVVRVSAKTIKSLDLSGATRIEASGLKVESLSVELSGASKATIKGSVESLNLDISGASNFDGSGLAVQKADVDCSGASHANVSVSDSLNVDASGASNVKYAGSAKVEKSVSGAASVKKI